MEAFVKAEGNQKSSGEMFTELEKGEMYCRDSALVTVKPRNVTSDVFSGVFRDKNLASISIEFAIEDLCRLR